MLSEDNAMCGSGNVIRYIFSKCGISSFVLKVREKVRFVGERLVAALVGVLVGLCPTWDVGGSIHGSILRVMKVSMQK